VFQNHAWAKDVSFTGQDRPVNVKIMDYKVYEMASDSILQLASKNIPFV
jgi:hypothetical protein